MLAKFLDELQADKKTISWSPEKEQKNREVWRLNALLREAEGGHSNLQSKLDKAENDLKQKTSTIKDLQLKLEHMKGDKQALQNEGEVKKSVPAVAK